MVIFDETVPIADRNKAIFSSASIGGIFPPVEIDGMNLADGGVAINALVGDPIVRCMEEEGVREKDIIIDIVLCLDAVVGINELSEADHLSMNAYDIFRRKVDIFTFHAAMRDLLPILRDFKHVQIRYVVYPTKPSPQGVSVIPLKSTV